MAEQLGLEGSQPVDLSKHPSGIVPTLQWVFLWVLFPSIFIYLCLSISEIICFLYIYFFFIRGWFGWSESYGINSVLDICKLIGYSLGLVLWSMSSWRFFSSCRIHMGNIKSLYELFVCYILQENCRAESPAIGFLFCSFCMWWNLCFILFRVSILKFYGRFLHSLEWTDLKRIVQLFCTLLCLVSIIKYYVFLVY